jgi:hypothetical protein
MTTGNHRQQERDGATLLTTAIKMKMRRCGLGTLDKAGRIWLRLTAFGYVLSAASEGRGALRMRSRAMTR